MLGKNSGYCTGAFYATGTVISFEGHVNNTGTGFDASRSNPIYGASDTVQPATITLIPQIKF